MKINGNTKVSKVIKENMDAIEVIASLNSHFTKLRNPILRRLLAPRVSIAEAAKIGKCDVQVMLDALVAIGFELENEAVDQKVKTDLAEDNSKNEFLEGQKITLLDVRPFLAKGEDPFNILQKALKKLEIDEVLEVLIDFEPIPLIRIQEKKGYLTLTVVEEGVYHTYFKAGELIKEEAPISNEGIKTISESDYNNLVNTYPGEIINLDVRNLEMPEPLVKILEAIEILDESTGLKIFHKKIPQHLLPELVAKNLNTFICPISEGNVMMFITKKHV
jgi:TusA-related sulfurtransferase